MERYSLPYNMMNESGNAAPEKLELEIQAMKDMRVLDPSRLILRTSAWAKGDDIEDQAKIHIRPYDEKVYWSGWYDYHRAGGPAVWNEGLYKGPEDYYNDTKNKREIVFFGAVHPVRIFHGIHIFRTGCRAVE